MSSSSSSSSAVEVAVRIRPFLERDDNESEAAVRCLPVTSATNSAAQVEVIFSEFDDPAVLSFDHCFDSVGYGQFHRNKNMDGSCENVYETLVRRPVQEFIDAATSVDEYHDSNNGTDAYAHAIFMYGQTNSGKTHTWDGIIRRVINQTSTFLDIMKNEDNNELSDEKEDDDDDQDEQEEFDENGDPLPRFDSKKEDRRRRRHQQQQQQKSRRSSSRGRSQSQSQQQKQKAAFLQVCAVELYNDYLFDIGRLEPVQIQCPAGVNPLNCLCWCDVQNAEDWEAIIDNVRANRSLQETSMNATSSRSHVLLMMRMVSLVSAAPMSTQQFGNGASSMHRGRTNINGNMMPQQQQQQQQQPQLVVRSQLCFVDLAGCERVSRSQASGDRLKEARYINASLASLGNVIHSLSAKGRNHQQQNQQHQQNHNGNAFSQHGAVLGRGTLAASAFSQQQQQLRAGTPSRGSRSSSVSSLGGGIGNGRTNPTTTIRRTNSPSARRVGNASSNAVAAAASQQQQHIHVPYRDSKLTWMLSDFFIAGSTGHGQLTVVVTVSPAMSDCQETLSALRFGARARGILICAPSKVHSRVDEQNQQQRSSSVRSNMNGNNSKSSNNNNNNNNKPVMNKQQQLEENFMSRRSQASSQRSNHNNNNENDDSLMMMKENIKNSKNVKSASFARSPSTSSKTARNNNNNNVEASANAFSRRTKRYHRDDESELQDTSALLENNTPDVRAKKILQKAAAAAKKAFASVTSPIPLASTTKQIKKSASSNSKKQHFVYDQRDDSFVAQDEDGSDGDRYSEKRDREDQDDSYTHYESPSLSRGRTNSARAPSNSNNHNNINIRRGVSVTSSSTTAKDKQQKSKSAYYSPTPSSTSRLMDESEFTFVTEPLQKRIDELEQLLVFINDDASRQIRQLREDKENSDAERQKAETLAKEREADAIAAESRVAVLQIRLDSLDMQTKAFTAEIHDHRRKSENKDELVREQQESYDKLKEEHDALLEQNANVLQVLGIFSSDHVKELTPTSIRSFFEWMLSELEEKQTERDTENGKLQQRVAELEKELEETRNEYAQHLRNSTDCASSPIEFPRNVADACVSVSPVSMMRHSSVSNHNNNDNNIIVLNNFNNKSQSQVRAKSNASVYSTSATAFYQPSEAYQNLFNNIANSGARRDFGVSGFYNSSNNNNNNNVMNTQQQYSNSSVERAPSVASTIMTSTTSIGRGGNNYNENNLRSSSTASAAPPVMLNPHQQQQVRKSVLDDLEMLSTNNNNNENNFYSSKNSQGVQQQNFGALEPPRDFVPVLSLFSQQQSITTPEKQRFLSLAVNNNNNNKNNNINGGGRSSGKKKASNKNVSSPLSSPNPAENTEMETSLRKLRRTLSEANNQEENFYSSSQQRRSSASLSNNQNSFFTKPLPGQYQHVDPNSHQHSTTSSRQLENASGMLSPLFIPSSKTSHTVSYNQSEENPRSTFWDRYAGSHEQNENNNNVAMI